MTIINNTFRSKVFKAAWTSLKSGKSKDLSEAVTSAWAWAKRTLIDAAYKVWSPKADFFRIYFGENQYAQISIKERSGYGYYECHRECKGETFATGWFKLINVSQDLFEQYSNEIAMDISTMGQTVDLVPSKF